MNNLLRKTNHTSIRSFVHRQNGLSKARQQALATLSPRYCLNPKKDLFHFEDIFKRNAPLVLEIGFGMGTNLLTHAECFKEKNFLGIEVYRPGIAATLSGIQQLALTNLRLIPGDAVEILNQCIKDRQFDLIQIFFPDPWPKNRHQKRRLIQPAFAQLLQKKLKINGVLQLATDWQDYAKQMMQVFENTSGLKNLTGSFQYAVRPKERLLTKFEQRGQKLGHLIWDLSFICL